MLQRIQSVFFLLAIIINLATFFVPMWQLSAGADTELITGLSVAGDSPQTEVMFFEHESASKLATHSGFFALVVISALFLGYVIFQYSDRKRQIRLGYMGIGLILLEILAFVLLSFQGPTTVSGGTYGSVAHFGFAFPVVALIFVWLAINRIKKDEELVRSVDRIR